MARFGSIEQYVAGSDFEDYIDRLEQFFAANDVTAMRMIEQTTTSRHAKAGADS